MDNILFQPSALSQISHEIRTPLTAILGMANFLKKTSLTKKQTEYLENILEAAYQLNGFENKLATILKNHKKN